MGLGSGMGCGSEAADATCQNARTQKAEPKHNRSGHER